MILKPKCYLLSAQLPFYLSKLLRLTFLKGQNHGGRRRLRRADRDGAVQDSRRELRALRGYFSRAAVAKHHRLGSL